MYPVVDPDAVQKLYWYRSCARPSLAQLAALLGMLAGGGLVLSHYITTTQSAVRAGKSGEPVVENGLKARPIILY
jgi:hypothetical protein